MLIAALLAACAAGARSPDTAVPAPVQGGEYIRAEIRGRLVRPGPADAARWQISASGIAVDLDFAGNPPLAEAAGRLTGGAVVASGDYREIADGRSVRRLLAVQRIEAAPPSDRPEYVDVTIRGTVRTGIIAVGAETTGVTITAAGVTWELAADGRQRQAIEALGGRLPVVSGELNRRGGIEIASRYIVTVRRVE